VTERRRHEGGALVQIKNFSFLLDCYQKPYPGAAREMHCWISSRELANG